MGVALVGWSGLTKDDEGDVDDDDEESTTGSPVIGFVLIFCQCIMAVIQGLSEEVFTQDGNFPPLKQVNGAANIAKDQFLRRRDNNRAVCL